MRLKHSLFREKQMNHFISIAVVLAATLGVTKSHAATPSPEVLIEFPENYSGYMSTFSMGYALTGSGAVVPAIYFNLSSTDPSGLYLWVSDGTPEGTHRATPGSITGNQATPDGTGRFFTALDGAGLLQVFRTDGPESSVRALTNEPVQSTSLNGALGNDALLSRPGPAGQTDAWRLDGATGTPTLLGRLPTSGTEWATIGQSVIGISYSGPVGYRVTGLPGIGIPPIDIPAPTPNTYWDYPHRMRAGTQIACVKAFTHYISPPDTRQELYCTDGTVQGTHRPASTVTNLGIGLLDYVEFYPIGDKLLIYGVSYPFFGTPTITDGTDSGTYPLFEQSVNSWTLCSDDQSGMIYFTTYGSNPQLFITDGSLAGTRSIMNLPTNTWVCKGKGAAIAGSSLAYLQIETSLVRTDGTESGTNPVAGTPTMLNDGGLGEPPRRIAALGQWLVFATALPNGREALWRLDIDTIFQDGVDD